MRNLMTWLVLLLAGSLPLEDSLSLGDSSNVSKLLGVLLAAVWLVVLAGSGRVRRPHPLHAAMALFVTWNLCSMWWTLDGPSTRTRVLTYAQLLLLGLIVWETVVTRAILDRVLRAYLVGCLLATGLLIGGYALDPSGSEWHGRVTVGTFNPNDAGLILALGLPVALYLLDRRAEQPTRIWWWLAGAYLPLGSFAVLVTGSRAAVAAAFPAAVYGGWLLWRRRPALLALAGAVLAALVLIALPLLPTRVTTRLAATGGDLAQGNLNHRQDIYGEGFRLIREHPLLGVGTGAFRTAAVGVDKVGHNVVLSLLTEIGPLGLALFLGMIVIAVRAGLRAPTSLRALWVAMFAAWASAALLHNWEYRKLTWLLFTLMAASSALRPDTPARERRAPARGTAGRRASAVGLLALVLPLLGIASPAQAALPDTPYPQISLDHVLHTTPFAGGNVSLQDNEGSAYVPRDGSLWLADDDGRQVVEVAPGSGTVKRVFDQAALAAVPARGGGPGPTTWQLRDLESIAYDAADDVLYVFSGSCCTDTEIPTVFRFTRGADGLLEPETYQALPAGSDFTAAAWNPADGMVYVGVQSDLRTYDWASNTAGATFQVPHLSRITGLDFSPDGSALYVAHALTRVSRVHWATRTIDAGWSFDLSSFGVMDARAVAVFDDRLWVSDGYDFRADGDPLSHAVFAFAVSPPPPDFNIVGNPGFESDLSGWNANRNAAADLARTTDAHSGGYAARLTNVSAAGTTLTLNDSPDWVGDAVLGGTYTVRAWVRSDNSTAGATLRIREYSQAGAKLSETSAGVWLSPQWQQLTLTVTPTADDTDLDLQVYATKVAAAGHLDVDDVAVNFSS